MMKNIPCVLVVIMLGLSGGVVFAQQGIGSDMHNAAAGQIEHNAVDSHGGDHEAHGEVHGEAHAEERPGLLSPDIGGAVWQVVLFLFLLIILGKFVWPKIIDGLQMREEKIRQDINSAEQANAKAQETLAEYEQKLSQTHMEAKKMLDQARDDAGQLRDKLMTEAEGDVSDLRKRATDEIKMAQQQAIGDLYAHAAELATVVAGKILTRQIDDNDTQRLVDESIKILNDNKAG